MGAAMLLSGIVAAIITSPIFDRVLTHHLGLAVRIICPIIAAAWLSLIWAGKKVLLPSPPSSLSLAILITVKPHNDAALFAIFIIIGVCSITLLPVAVELGVELTRNTDGSSAVLWFLCALCFFTEFAPHKTDFLCSKRKYVVCRLCIRSASPFQPSAQCPCPPFADIYIYILCPYSILSFAVQGALRASPAASPPQNMHATIIFNGVWASTVASLIFFLEGKQTRRELDEQMYEERDIKGTQSVQMVKLFSSQESGEEK
jgi:FLVCR family MFS transporter 7